ncbi:Outer membrane protein assembly factor BamB [Halomonadaceae bacterium LMG 33818]|uniref:membrane-bound PQQ-dependent dehydrogenase, glucose/quinate/shikimate family n=1 Tax=Cernens ardua TaxID=3402176 RepID=UPI003EDC3DCC
MRTHAIWPVKILSIIVFLLGLTLLVGGIDLISAGGSWYYAISGIFLLVSAILLWANKKSGAVIYGIFFIGTLFWTLYESGFNIWGWIPRVGLPAILALWLVLCLPRLGAGVSKRMTGSLVGIIVICFAVAIYAVTGTQFSFTSGTPAPNQPLVNNGTTTTNQPDSDWQEYGRDANGTRFSPLNQITPKNVTHLQVAWEYRTHDLPPKDKPNKWAEENTPIKVGNGLFVCSATDDVIRLDPATGQQVWRWNSGVKYDSVPYTAACRGLTYFTSKVVPQGQMCHNRILVATLDARLAEVDAETGKPCDQFGNHGQESVMQGIGESVPGWLAMNDAMPIVNGVIVTNHEVLDGQARWAPSGVIRGWDAETGKFRWAWDVNRPDDHGLPPAGKTYSRGTPNSWTTMTADPQLNLVYVPTGNSAGDYYSAERSPLENKVSSSVVALDATTGHVRWVFQTTHKDVWDYDMGSQVTLFDYPGPNGTSIPAMLVPTKRGENFILDRRNGKPLSPVVEKTAPAGHIPGDPRAPTQPFSVGMPQFRKFARITESKMWGLTPVDQMMCRIMFRHSNYDGDFTAPSLKRPWLEYPSYNGGSDWGSIAYDPQTGIMVGNWNNMVFRDQLVTREYADKAHMFAINDPRYRPGTSSAEGAGAQAQTPYGVLVSPFYAPFTKMLCDEPPYGMITAVNMHTHKVIWQHALGTGQYNGPFGIPTHTPVNVGVPNNGGPIITAGGLIFVSATTDRELRAFDVRTGKEVWHYVLPTGGQATPMTYSVNGQQYVVITAGGHHFMGTPPGDYVIAFKLPSQGDEQGK